MDSRTDPQSLSHDQLSSLVFSMYDSDNYTFEKEYRARCAEGQIPSPFFHALKTFEKVSTWNRQPIYESMKKNWLFLAVLSKVKSDPAFYGKARSQTAIDSIDKEVAKVSTILTLISDIKNIDSLSIEFFKECIGSVKDQQGRYIDELPERTQTGIRKLALALHLATGEFNFISIAKSARIPKNKVIAHHQSDSLPDSKYNDWLNYFQDYLNERVLKSTRSHYNSFNRFYDYLVTQDNSHNPLVFLTKKSSYSFFDFLKDKSSPLVKQTCNHMYDFTNWIIDNNLVDRDEQSGELTTIGVSIFSTSEINRISGSDSGPYKPAETVKHAMPTSWLIKCREIITYNDFEWPKTRSNDYFWYRNPEDGKDHHIWIPVNALIILVMLELPIRKIQVLSLDSGEGDEDFYDVDQKAWLKNTSKNAGYWSKFGTSRKERGVVKKIYANGKPTAGFYINTNKTQDREHGFSETSGYTIPWNNEYLIRKLTELRAWQEKFNLLNKPTRFRDIPKSVFNYQPTEIALEQIPDRFYLFRSPLANQGQSPDCPPSENIIIRFWWDLMEELESRLRREGQNIEIVIKRNCVTGQPERTIFTPHGLRASGLTALSEAGVPIEILSKIIAGHSTILMTLYYMKMEPGHVTERLNEAKKKIEQGQQENLRQWLANAVWADAQRYMASNDKSTLKEMNEGSIPSGLWLNNNLGICPYGGTRCQDGGTLIRKSNKNNPPLYGPVLGGSQNCVRCRHFVTGTPWLIPLWLHSNKLLIDAQMMSKQLENLRKKFESANSERFRLVKENGTDSIPASLHSEIKGLASLLEKNSNALDSILMDAHATYRLLTDVREILANIDTYEENTKNLPSLIVTDAPEIGFNEVGEFRALDEIVQAGRLYAHIQDENIENERNHFIDQIMFNNGMTPISLAPLSSIEKSAASDAAAKFLMARLEDFELEALSSNRTTLEELNLKSEFKKSLHLDAPSSLNLIFKSDD